MQEEPEREEQVEEEVGNGQVHLNGEDEEEEDDYYYKRTPIKVLQSSMPLSPTHCSSVPLSNKLYLSLKIAFIVKQPGEIALVYHSLSLPRTYLILSNYRTNVIYNTAVLPLNYLSRF